LEPGTSMAATSAAAMATTTPTPPVTRPKREAKVEISCKRARAPGYRLCEHARVRGFRSLRATLEVRDGDAWQLIAREPRGAFRGGKEWGAWSAVWLSPNRRTLLAEWMSECDTHRAFFVPAQGGPPRPVTGERDWRMSPPSLPYGWAADGRARVWVLQGGGCSSKAPIEPGRYLIDPTSGMRTRHGDLGGRR
jgi:hypothetical protein